MLTVKVYTREQDGFSMDKKVVISALSATTDYYTQDGEVYHYLVVKDFKGEERTFNIIKGRRIFIENLYGKTVEMYGNVCDKIE